MPPCDCRSYGGRGEVTLFIVRALPASTTLGILNEVIKMFQDYQKYHFIENRGYYQPNLRLLKNNKANKICPIILKSLGVMQVLS